jgi:hypothetical protein
MALTDYYHDISGLKVNKLVNWRINPLTNAQRLTLETTLGLEHTGLFVYDETLMSGFIWTGSSWSSGLVVESDPFFTASPAFSITNTDINNWNTAFSWGNHALAGYLTSFIETDPIWISDKPSYLTIAAASATYSLLGHTHTFASLTSKPTTLAGYGIIDAYPLTGNPSGFLTSLTAGLLYVPLNRELTINGVTFDLAADRVWTVTSVLSDGDYGDITVSGLGTILTIDNGLDSSKIADGSVSNIEFQYLNGASSNIQNQINNLEADVIALAVAL